MKLELRGYEQTARAYLEKGLRTYGLPTEGPIYEGNLRALIDEQAHDFRLAELPSVIRDPAALTHRRRFLDLGCGPGTFVFRALMAGHEAVGIDLSDEKVALAKDWRRARSLPEDWDDRLMVADGGDLPFPDQAFDVVTSYHVLEHVSDLPSVLFEAVRVTRRGGWLELRAPDYRMSYDTHYSMPWPRFMPPAQSRVWAEAMGRPSDGVGSFFYVTAPQVVAILEALGCEVVTHVLREHRNGMTTAFNGRLDIDPIIFRSDSDVRALATELLDLQRMNRLPRAYNTCLEFTIAARRL